MTTPNDPARPPKIDKDEMRKRQQAACRRIPCAGAQMGNPLCVFCPHERKVK